MMEQNLNNKSSDNPISIDQPVLGEATSPNEPAEVKLDPPSLTTDPKQSTTAVEPDPQTLEKSERKPLPPVEPGREASSGQPQVKQPDLPPPPESTTSQQGADAPQEVEKRKEGTLDLLIHDWHGKPIPKLEFRIVIKGKVIYKGITKANGRPDLITGLPLGIPLEFQIKRQARADAEETYNFAAITTIRSDESYGALESPKAKFDFSTEPNPGAPGSADMRKIQIAEGHNQKPAQAPELSGNKDKDVTLKAERDALGRPKLLAVSNQTDWFGRNAIGQGAPAEGISDVQRVKKLIEFAEKQATWKYSSAITAGSYVNKMIAKKFETPESKLKDGYEHSVAMCAKYVKVALWYAGFGPETEPIGNGVADARDMGAALTAAGFKNVTTSLPDGRWAAPGDVIVYQKIGNPTASGHIDIRTYDGYISDFLGLYLPVSKFKVMGIYRKYFDPLPVKSMRAFLMVIASREAKTIFSSDGYQEAYRTLPATKGKPKEEFDDFQTHPFSGKPPMSSPSGAYGITVDTWKNYMKFLDLSEKEAKFTPTIQDRIAICIMEQTENALKLVRMGQIEDAAKILARRKQWTSLPTGSENNNFTVADMMESYQNFLSKIK